MKKVLGLLFTTLIFVASVSALTWSGLFENNSKLSNSDPKFNQSNGIYFSIATPVTKDGNINFVAEALYKYNLAVADDTNDFTNIIDLDLFKLNGKWNISSGVINLNAGRFSYSDISAAVFSQTSDGVRFAYDSTKLKFSMYAGYTGLVNSLNVSMTAPAAGEESQLYNLCAGYIPLSAEVSYKIGTNLVGIQAMYFMDPKQELPSLLYGSLALNGSISTIGLYSLVATFGTADFDNAMLYSKGNVSFYIAQSGILSAGVEYVSGNQFGLSDFTTVTAYSPLNAGIASSGLLLPYISAMFIKNNLYISLTEKAVVVMPEDSADFEGSDTSLSVLYNLFTDLQLGLDVNVFFDINSSELNNYSGTIKASLSF